MPAPGGKPAEGVRVAVAGGSLGGLTAALVLRDIGCEVDVYERSASALEGYGAGIVAHQAATRYFTERTDVSLEQVTLQVPWFRFVDREGDEYHREPNPWYYSSWGTIYKGLFGVFDEARYHRGHALSAIDQDGDRVRATFENGREIECDLLVCADGLMSTGRRLIHPDAGAEYAGYVGWRGIFPEAAVAQSTQDAFGDAITYYIPPLSHFIIYPIPSHEGSIAPGERLLNFVWYRNVSEEKLASILTDRDGVQRSLSLPQGALAESHRDDFRADSRELLPERMADVMVQVADPFLQAIVDLTVPRMAVGRVCLVGDAAFVARPHAAAGTAKAAADGWALADALADAGGDVPSALAVWEPQQRGVGERLIQRVREIGDRSQVHGTFKPGDPKNRFGLYGPGR